MERLGEIFLEEDKTTFPGHDLCPIDYSCLLIYIFI